MSSGVPPAARNSARQGLSGESGLPPASALRWFRPRGSESPAPVYHVADQPYSVQDRHTGRPELPVAAHWRAEETLRSMRSRRSTKTRTRLFRKRVSWLSLLAAFLLVGILIHACVSGRWQFVLPTLVLLGLVVAAVVTLRQS